VSNADSSQDQGQDDAYGWYKRAGQLLESGNPHAALLLIDRLMSVEPQSASVMEMYARALFDTSDFRAASMAFDVLIQLSPDNDYAHFGKGMCLWRLQQFILSRDELGMASAMRPDRLEYARAYGQVKATLRARIEAGLPLNGPIEQQGDFDRILGDDS
jgi:Flp pilus assembly protein TadD